MPNLIKKSWTVSIAHALECTSELRSIYVQWCTFSLDFSFVITNYGCVWWILMLKQNSNHVTLMHLSTFFLSPFLLLHFARLTGRGVTWVTFFHNYLGLLTLVAQWNEIPFEVAFVNLCSVYWKKSLKSERMVSITKSANSIFNKNERDFAPWSQVHNLATCNRKFAIWQFGNLPT